MPTFLVEHAAAVPVALLLLVLGCAGLGLLVRRRPRATAWLLAAALLPVVGLTLAPDGRGRRAEQWCQAGFSLPSLGSVELLANVALFVPAAVFGVLLLRRPVLVVLGGSALSAAVEVVQASAPALGRSCTTDDWAMNTAGTIVGVLVGVLVGSPLPGVGRIRRRG
nr:VanZ family protein [Kineococcus aurantiacus]